MDGKGRAALHVLWPPSGLRLRAYAEKGQKEGHMCSCVHVRMCVRAYVFMLMRKQPNVNINKDDDCHDNDNDDDNGPLCLSPREPFGDREQARTGGKAENASR